MVKVKINSKTYNVKEMEFEEYLHMEEEGVSIVDAFRKNQVTLIALGFTCVAADCDRNEAARLINQHILGGGSLYSITRAFGEAIAESDFFQKMLNPEVETAEKPKVSRAKKIETAEE